MRSARVTSSDRLEHDERSAALHVLLRHYYRYGHTRLHVVRSVDLDTIGPVGRRDEVSPLAKAVLAVPHALAGDYRFSPLAAHGPRINTHRALTDHARLVTALLDRGCEVFLLLQPNVATEAVYATDIVTGIADVAVVGSALHPARRAEQRIFRGGIRLDVDVPAPGSVEWGDTLHATRGGVHYLVQGYNSMRGTSESVTRVAKLIACLNERGAAIEHVPVELSGSDTLHLDYAANYAGVGRTRSMLVAPDAIADNNMIDRLQWIFSVPSGGVFEVDRRSMLDAAANISCPNPREVFIADNRATKPAQAFLASRGLTVTPLPFHMTRKDGALHCCIGQLLRL
jgi:N-dimethylarginine dimethylaminohydrolase